MAVEDSEWLYGYFITFYNDSIIFRRQPPTVKQLDERYTVIQGQEFSLICEGSGNPYPSVKWIKQHETFEPNTQQNGNILRITNAVPANRGVYTCTVENPGGIVETNTIIEVERKYFLNLIFINISLKLYHLFCNCKALKTGVGKLLIHFTIIIILYL